MLFFHFVKCKFRKFVIKKQHVICIVNIKRTILLTYCAVYNFERITAVFTEINSLINNIIMISLCNFVPWCLSGKKNATKALRH